MSLKPDDSAHKTGETAKPCRTTRYDLTTRATGAELSEGVTAVANNRLINSVLSAVNGLCAVLNEHRQILALNKPYMMFMGVEDASKATGLRTGELIRCIHANQMPGGCGTAQHCVTCGAERSIMMAIANEKPQETTCVMTVEKDKREVDVFFQVRCCPITINGMRFVLFFLHDTKGQKHGNLDETFFQNICSLLTGLLEDIESF